MAQRKAGPVPERHGAQQTDRAGKGRGGHEFWLFAAGAIMALAGALTGGKAGGAVWGLPAGVSRSVAAGLMAAGGSLVLLAVLFALTRRLRPAYRLWLRARLAMVLRADPVPGLATDAARVIGYLNPSARRRFGAVQGGGLESALAGSFAAPDLMLQRLQDRARTRGGAQEELQTARGHTLISVHRLGRHGYLWRILEHLPDAEEEQGSLPQMVLSRGGEVLSLNAPLRALVGQDAQGLDQVVADLPLRPGEEHSLIGAGGRLRCFLGMTMGRNGRQHLTFLPLSDARAASHDPAAFERLPVALMRLAPDGRVLGLNGSARRLTGNVAIGSRLADLFEGLGRPVADWVADARAGRADRRPEVMRLRNRKEEVFLHVSLNRVVADGQAEFIAVLTDATQLKTLEAKFVQAQKMQAIGHLAGGVAHDFNNLLTAISGHCDLLMLRHDKADPDYADLDQISQNANRAAALVRQLLAFSRKQTLNPEILHLRDTLSDLTHLLNRLVGEKIVLSFTHDPDLRPIRADKRQLEQVIMNLVVNARDAMPGGGEIRIETETLQLHEDLRRDRAVVPKGEYVQVRVRDEGTGIPPEMLSKIFEPFFTTKRSGEGTGLGLSTAYGIVKQTGGYIFCDSEPGRGSCFILLLPTCEEPPPAEPAPETLTAPLSDPATATILLVEDEAPVRAFAARALRLRGYSVLEAENGEDALGLLADPELHVDIFLSDVIMPAMDGPSWVAEALKNRPETAVIFVSGYAEDAFRHGLPQLPNSVFLPKPFSLSELTATVGTVLRASRSGAESPQEGAGDIPAENAKPSSDQEAAAFPARPTPQDAAIIPVAPLP